MKHLWDGFLSLLAGVATAVICGVPAWFTYQAVQAGIAPDWATVSVVLLGGMGVILTFAFLRKARAGISPTRDRKRR